MSVGTWLVGSREVDPGPILVGGRKADPEPSLRLKSSVGVTVSVSPSPGKERGLDLSVLFDLPCSDDGPGFNGSGLSVGTWLVTTQGLAQDPIFFGTRGGREVDPEPILVGTRGGRDADQEPGPGPGPGAESNG